MKHAKYLFDTNGMSIYLYRGDPFTPSMVPLDQVTIQARIRLFFEWFYGRRVYYAKLIGSNEWLGYCAVVSGRNPRYFFSGKHDIVFGHYMIIPKYRGKGFSVKLLKSVMDNAENNYDNAYAYVSTDNIISQRAITSFGGEAICNLSINGLFRRIRRCDGEGNFVLFKRKRVI